jgi:hypothetical protein
MLGVAGTSAERGGQGHFIHSTASEVRIMADIIGTNVSRSPATGAASPTRPSRKSGAAAPHPAAFAGEDRYRMIAEAAYYRAEQRGFTPGSELDDWLAAEIEVDALLADSGGPQA